MSNVNLRHRPLGLAARKKDMPVVRQLLRDGRCSQEEIDIALACTLCYGNEATQWSQIKAIADLLLEHGANVNAFEGDYGPIVFGMGECLMPNGLAYLIEHGADVTFKPVHTKYGLQCPLSYWLGAYVRGQNERKHQGINLLLEHDAYIPPQITPAMLAVHRGDAELLAQLIEQNPLLVHERFADMPYGNLLLKGATLLHCAVEHDEIQCCKVLLDHGADINSQADVIHNVGGQTPLFHLINTHWASHLATLEFLVQQAGEKIDMSIAATFERYDGVRTTPVTAMQLALEELPEYSRANKEAELLILENIDRPVLTDPIFKTAVHAVQQGDLPALKSLLAAYPKLASDHAIEPAYYRQTYFRDPALLWFVANNPNLIKTMPANSVDIARVIIEAGAKPEDLNYTLALVATSRPAREEKHQRPLMKLLLDHGATVDANIFNGILGHKEIDAAEALLEYGVALNAPAAAGLGMTDKLPALLETADAQAIHQAFSLAVINGEVAAAKMCLDAGADVNAQLSNHVHSHAAHQAAINDDVPMLTLLIERGAKLDVKDTLWHATPLGWAKHGGCARAIAYLESV